MTMAQRLEVGPITLHVIRLLIAVGAVRVVARGERILGGLNGLDGTMLAWAGCAIISSVFHKTTAEGNPLIFRLGLVYNTLGIYFLFRVFIQSIEDLVHLIKIMACVLAPVALEMFQEHITKRNLFSVLGGVPEMAWVRDGKLRSQGPFSHPILAGTVGAVCFPLMISIYRQSPKAALFGSGVCVAMVLTSSSSGPLMSLIFGVFALILWRWRHLTQHFRIGAVIAYVVLSMVMTDPAYYIIARIDLTGSSTGWHRARLIEMAFANIGEWWVGGTDYTRHWMPTGVSWSEDHTDITNYYIKMGVIGGLPLMLLLIAALVTAFRYIGHSLRATDGKSLTGQFFIWAIGAALLTHTATCVSVSYFDQSFVFIYLNLAVISSLRSAILLQEVVHEEIEDEEEEGEQDFDSSGRRNSELGSLGGAPSGTAGLRFV